MRCVVTRVPRNMSTDDNRKPVHYHRVLDPIDGVSYNIVTKEYPEISPQFALC